MKEIHDDRLKMSIDTLNLGTAPCLTVNQSMKAIDVFKIMDAKGLSGIALVDDHGKLTGNLSSRDLKAFIKFIDFNQLVASVGDFIKFIRQTAQTDTDNPTITCFPHDTFEHIIGKLSATRVHRLFVVASEEFFSPVRVVSLLDTLAKLHEHK